ncbi:MAG: metal-dependent hydrolase [Nanoarchaeota archaeon]|nr:metal-dependent hydrolase [Nanoarchaeota archaeon]
MPLAVTHVLLTIILIDLYRDYVTKHKRFFSLEIVLIGGVAGLLPDIDIPLGWIMKYFGINIVHGSVTHTPWFALLFLIPAFIFLNRGNRKSATLYFVISFGVFFHIFLDWFLGGGMHEGVMWLYPFSMQAFKLHLTSMIGWKNLPAGIDAILLLGWLWHEEVKHKIKDFI